MKFQFVEQTFQTDAVEAVCNLFVGQRRQSSNFRMTRDDEIIIGGNAPLKLTNEQILHNLRGVQSKNSLPLSEKLDGLNFSVEMETGVGKTYTYIKTMYELNARYGWSKFVIVVPSVAIREGVKKTFEMTAEHFNQKYGADNAIHYFVYNSANLNELKSFSGDTGIWAMIVNVQAFNSTSNDARRIFRDELDDFGSRVPIEAVAQTNPIIIIDEPQSVEGKIARERMPRFKPLMTLRYSATHKNIFNLVYRLDALDAYQRRLVKKISVKGIEVVGGQSRGFIFFDRVNVTKNEPTATLTFKRRGASAINRITRNVKVGDNLYRLSNELADYRDNFIVTEIDGAEDSIAFLNGLKLFAGQATGDASEDELRRLQIRLTIKTHLEREKELYGHGIKVLSLFFIDEVAKYRAFDEQNNPTPGLYAKIFVEEYNAAVKNFQPDDEAYRAYLDAIAAQDTHAGYFSVDKKNRPTNSDDVDTYDLIMRDKEKLLDFRTPVRFIFSHSALREGWDNPNVFQICTLKHTSSEIKKRQEVGRGMRLCVNQSGERVEDDKSNILTVVANESYRSFADGLQKEIADAVNRPTIIDTNFFIGKKLAGRVIDEERAFGIFIGLAGQKYLSPKGHLTEKFFTDKERGEISLGDLKEPVEGVLKLLGETVRGGYEIEDANKINVEAHIDEDKLAAPNFQELWKRINRKSFYSVKFDSAEFITRAIDALNRRLIVPENKFVVESGTLEDISQSLGFVDDKNSHIREDFQVETEPVDVDVIGELVKATCLTRRDLAEIISGVPKVFALIGRGVDKFITEAARIINDVKAAKISDEITYTALDETFSIKIFRVPLRGRRNVNAVETEKNLYDYLISDSATEKKFAAALERAADVSVYVKLPKSFYIPTPLGRYTPDWAIVWRNEAYFVVETKGSDAEAQLRGVESGKISCAEKFFEAISGGKVKYTVTKNYRQLEDFLEAVGKLKLHKEG